MIARYRCGTQVCMQMNVMNALLLCCFDLTPVERVVSAFMLVGSGKGFRISDSAVCAHHLSAVVRVKMQHLHYPDQIDVGLKRTEAQISAICCVLVRGDHSRIKAKTVLCLISLVNYPSTLRIAPANSSAANLAT